MRPPSTLLPEALAMPPFVGTLGDAEAEHAAAVLIVILAENGDTWGPIKREQFYAARNSPTLAAQARNPFFRPHIGHLVDAGYAQYTDRDHHALVFTSKFFDTMSTFFTSMDTKEQRT